METNRKEWKTGGRLRDCWSEGQAPIKQKRDGQGVAVGGGIKGSEWVPAGLIEARTASNKVLILLLVPNKFVCKVQNERQLYKASQNAEAS